MDDLHAVYLSRLQARLSRRLPEPVVREYVSEINLHIQESIADQVSRGQTVEIATVHALKAVGSERLVADSLIRARNGINARSAWSFAWIPVCILMLYGLITMSFSLVEPPSERLVTIVSWLPNCFFLSLVVACWRSRRSLFGPMATTIAILFVATIVQVVGFSPIGVTSLSRHTRAQLLFSLRTSISNLEDQIQFAHTSSSDIPFPPSLRYGHYFMAPKQAGLKPEYGYALVPVPSQGEARKLWNKFGTKYAASLGWELRNDRENQAGWIKAKLDATEVRRIVVRLLAMAAFALSVILVGSLLVLGLGIAYRKMIEYLWRPERLV